jgi:hypothetical protein
VSSAAAGDRPRGCADSQRLPAEAAVTAQPDLESQGAEAFGKAFALLMRRLTDEVELLATSTDDRARLERIRREVALRFEQEAEQLIAGHLVAETVAQYVRHVVREGFEADFDPMDPTELPSRPRGERAGATGWTRAVPTRAGAYAIQQAGSPDPIELARFERVDERWLASRWGVAGAVPWDDLAGHGWRRWVADTPTPVP